MYETCAEHSLDCYRVASNCSNHRHVQAWLQSSNLLSSDCVRFPMLTSCNVQTCTGSQHLITSEKFRSKTIGKEEERSLPADAISWTASPQFIAHKIGKVGSCLPNRWHVRWNSAFLFIMAGASEKKIIVGQLLHLYIDGKEIMSQGCSRSDQRKERENESWSERRELHCRVPLVNKHRNQDYSRARYAHCCPRLRHRLKKENQNKRK